MMGLKPREERVPVAIRARMRTDCGWGDVVIGNVSSRGLMLRTPEPPAGLTYIEVRYQTVVIVGRIVWTNGLHCGVRTQDSVDIPALLSPRPGSRPKRGEDRRRRTRRDPAPALRRPSSGEMLAHSRRLARLFEFGAVGLLVAGGCFLAATSVVEVLGRPLTATLAALSN